MITIQNKIVTNGIPVGTIVPWLGKNIPTGFLECNGQEVSIIKYIDLYNLAYNNGLIGTFFGSGNGSTTFNIPDLRELTLVGTDANNPKNDTNSITNHYIDSDQNYQWIGTFKDDQFKNHTHGYNNTSCSNDFGGTGGSRRTTDKTGTTWETRNCRSGDVTRGKQIGVVWIIRAIQ